MTPAKKATYYQRQRSALIYAANKAFLRNVLNRPPIFRLKFAWAIITKKGFGFENE